MKKLTHLFSLALALALMIVCLASPAYATEDWHAERAELLMEELYQLSGSDLFIEMYTGAGEVKELISGWHDEMTGAETTIDRYTSAMDLMTFAMASLDGMPDAAVKRIKRDASTMAFAHANGQQGSTHLAASTLLTLTESYVMPEGFEPMILLYEYDTICVGVAFYEGGEGVVTATAQFVAPEVKNYLVEYDITTPEGVGGALTDMFN